ARLQHRDAGLLQAQRGAFGAGHRAGDGEAPGGDLGRQGVDEAVHRGAGAHAEDLAGRDVGDRCVADELLELVLVHAAILRDGRRQPGALLAWPSADDGLTRCRIHGLLPRGIPGREAVLDHITRLQATRDVTVHAAVGAQAHGLRVAAVDAVVHVHPAAGGRGERQRRCARLRARRVDRRPATAGRVGPGAVGRVGAALPLPAEIGAGHGDEPVVARRQRPAGGAERRVGERVGELGAVEPAGGRGQRAGARQDAERDGAGAVDRGQQRLDRAGAAQAEGDGDVLPGEQRRGPAVELVDVGAVAVVHDDAGGAGVGRQAGEQQRGNGAGATTAGDRTDRGQAREQQREAGGLGDGGSGEHELEVIHQHGIGPAVEDGADRRADLEEQRGRARGNGGSLEADLRPAAGVDLRLELAVQRQHVAAGGEVLQLHEGVAGGTGIALGPEGQPRGVAHVGGGQRRQAAVADRVLQGDGGIEAIGGAEQQREAAGVGVGGQRRRAAGGRVG
ncbi:hypothetical protein OSTOST_12909, partial [Ostertagia ostertagi]